MSVILGLVAGYALGLAYLRFADERGWWPFRESEP